MAVQTFARQTEVIELSKTEPEKLHSFEYNDREIFALPDTGIILGRKDDGDGRTEMRVRSEAYDREGNAYSVVMEYTVERNENGLAGLAEPARAEDIQPIVRQMSLPLDWNGALEVRGCADDMDGVIRSDITDREQIQFYGVYANTRSGEQQHLADFDTEASAKRYAALVDREYERQTGREAATERSQQPREADRTAGEQSRTAPQEPTVAPRDECIAAMQSVGMIVSGDHPIFDKQSHRIAVEGDKSGEMSGFYVAHPDGRPSGYVKNNKTGEEKRWSAKGYILDDSQKKALHEQAKENVAKRDGELTEQHDKTAKRLQGQIKRYDKPQVQTPYMKSKDIQLHPGVYQNGNSTCIPLYNTNGEIRSMAYVQEDGTKRYAKNSEKEGCFHIVGGQDALKKAPVIVISEGYATAATISESIGRPVVAAMDAGNVVDVAKALRAAYPDKPIVIAADNDAKLEADTGINPGRNYAAQAAEAVNGVVAFPAFSKTDGESKQLTDFNDLARQHGELGKEAVKGQLQPVIDREIVKVEKSREQEAKVEKSRGQKELARA
jgi:phage/plasmid primase-like uncharacterized protein